MIVWVIVLILLWLMCRNNEGLVNRPNQREKKKYINEMMINKNKFGGTLNSARKTMPWVDVVVYEDARGLLENNKFTEENLSKILS